MLFRSFIGCKIPNKAGAFFRTIKFACVVQMETPKRLGNPSILRRLGGLELKLQPVSNQRNKLTIGGLALGVAHRVAKEALQGVQVSPVPGYLDGVADGPFYP